MQKEYLTKIQHLFKVKNLCKLKISGNFSQPDEEHLQNTANIIVSGD